MELKRRQVGIEVKSKIRLGDTLDMSENAQFNWYQYIWYVDPKIREMDKKKLARFVGVATNVGSKMKFWYLFPSGLVVVRSSVTLVTSGELILTGIQPQLKDLDSVIHDKIRDELFEMHVIFAGISLPLIDIFENNIDLDDTSGKLWGPMEPGSVKPEADDHRIEAYDKSLNAQVIVSLAGGLSKGKVLK